MIILAILCVLSIGINVLLVWYIKKVLSKLLFVSDNIGGLLEEMTSFVFHLETIHEMETYYGDATLGELIKHSKELSQNIKKYREIYTLTEEGLENELEEMENFYEHEEEEAE
tara:strand:- start:26 stop:364 length:339 start_codon:yes stop_codon:yes gene_type:complete